jgi:hypothetical protein
LKYLDSGSRNPAHSLASWLDSILNDGVAELRFQTGFFSLDGIGLLVPTLEQCKQNNLITKVLIGSNEASTLKDDVLGLIEALGIPRDGAQLGIVSFSGAFFHPKTYHIKRPDGSQAAFVGSANLTASGLALHVEAGIALDTRDGDVPHHLSQIATAIDSWFSEQRAGMTLIAGLQVVDELVESGILALLRPPRPSVNDKNGATDKKSRPRLKSLFQLPKVKGATPYDEVIGPEDDTVLEVLPPAAAQPGSYQIFLMTLQKTDVGFGQTTKGTSRRSPEIFIPLAARDADEDFWGWPNLFHEDPSKKGKMDRFGVKMRIGTSIVDVNMMTWPAKHDFRLRSETLRSAGNIGDILYLERSDGSSGFNYYVEIIPQGSTRHGQYLARCVNAVRNSTRKWGYI